MSTKAAIRKLSEQSQSATEQAAETLRETKELVAARIASMRLRLGLEPRRQSYSELPSVTR